MSKQTLVERLLGKEADKFKHKLKMFSVSDQDAELREQTYSRVLQNTMDLEDKVNGRTRRNFSGASVTASNLSGVSIYSGIMKSYVNSIAPIFCVERDLDTPKQQLAYIDFYDVLTNTLAVPNIGPDTAWNRQVDRKTEVIVPATPLAITYGDPIVPRSFSAEVYKNDVLLGTIQDNGAGKFLATPGLIQAASAINYNNNGAATISFTWAAGLDANKLVYACDHDVTAKDEVNKAYGQVKYYNMSTDPVLVPVERNIVADHAMAKQGILNADELYSNFVENEYTKIVNRKVFESLTQNYVGDTYELDLSSFTIAAGKWDTIVRTFLGACSQAENLIAAQTYRGAKVTGILASPASIQVFDLLSQDMGWIKNTESTYYQDIAGWFNQVPVVRCTTLGEGEIMFTHRTSDGQLGPCFRGMFLAPTEMPVIGNYKNMTNYATGMYSMEGVGYTSSKLCVKIKVILPTDLTLVKL